MRSIKAFLWTWVVAGFCAASARATVIQMWSGTSSAGVAVSFEADFTISGNTLTIDLHNNSPVPSANPNDLLSSFYFDLTCGSVRPTLTYLSATGDVWTIHSGATPDSFTEASADLMAVVAGDDTWQFRNMNDALAPFLGFGIGTVGNSNLSPNNFMGNIVDGRDYSIHHGDVSSSNLNGELLVLDHAQFVFSGVSGCTEADIHTVSAFGLGTAPDSLEYTPEPATLPLLLVGLLGLRRRR